MAAAVGPAAAGGPPAVGGAVALRGCGCSWKPEVGGLGSLFSGSYTTFGWLSWAGSGWTAAWLSRTGVGSEAGKKMSRCSLVYLGVVGVSAADCWRQEKKNRDGTEMRLWSLLSQTTTQRDPLTVIKSSGEQWLRPTRASRLPRQLNSECAGGEELHCSSVCPSEDLLQTRAAQTICDNSRCHGNTEEAS